MDGAADPPTVDRSTRLAEDRTVLAAERTFASWLRTELSFLVAGLAVQRFLREVLPDWQLRGLALALILCAMASFAVAGWRDSQMRRRLAGAEVGMVPVALSLGIPALLVVVSAVALLGLSLM